MYTKGIQKKVKLGLLLKKKSSKFIGIIIRTYYIWRYFLLLFLISILSYLISINTILSDIYYVKIISYTPETIKTFYDPYIYQELENNFINRNYYYLKYYKIYYINKLFQDKYKIIKKININNIVNNQILLSIDFSPPKLILQNINGKFGIKDQYIFYLSTGNNSLTGLIINIPDYLKDLKQFSGFFYQMTENNLYDQFIQIINYYGLQNIKQIYYIPGGSKSIFYLKNNKTIYFNNLKNISVQLEKFANIRETYNDFGALKEIDLGSIDDIIVR